MFTHSTLAALKNVQRALNEAGHGGRIKATVPLNADVYDSVNNQPSTGSFRSDIASIMVDLFRFLAANGSPCMVNIYPFLSLTQDENFPVNFAFFDDGNVGIQDKDKTYYNVFDANFDTLVWALKKVGISDIEIIVGEIGWPTDGARHADIASAKRFYDGFLKKMASRKGTPMHPKPIKAYAFGLIDEDAKSILPGEFERHWGLLSYDGRPKFAVDLSGKGNNSRLLAGAKGVEYMEKKWCLFNPDAATDPAAIAGNIQYACSRADCSAAAEGGSCYRLSSPESDASYAFNQYFQAMDQDVRACDFDGMAMTVEKNASTERCLFPIMVVSSGERSTAAAVAGAFLFAMVAALMFTAG
ncbi:Glucan endo-1,3-beta-glucosidase 8 [Apostasia shenzhenica]|uniref:Glucan endo-1,3-beta-glucosidase 8 n=1 Tax=Apostasia shenzhenica TaxID=1088818 RepID=A0A2I0AE40_9ASPA|nr:Glucan endo-1,3-beta-glucosidase 8 [Apostasia shenzhenica]